MKFLRLEDFLWTVDIVFVAQGKKFVIVVDGKCFSFFFRARISQALARKDTNATIVKWKKGKKALVRERTLEKAYLWYFYPCKILY